MLSLVLSCRVFTSFCFMVDHAGDLVVTNAILGPLYIVAIMCYACIAFRIGRFLTNTIWQRESRALMRIQLHGTSMLRFLGSFIGILLLIAIFGPAGFVR